MGVWLGNVVLLVKLEDTLTGRGGLVLIHRGRDLLECGPLGGFTAVVPVTQMLHGRGLLL